MKVALKVAALALIFASCQKNLSDKEESLSSTISSDASLPLNCHSLSLVTEYPIIPWKVPPFTFTKTLYTNGRVNRISMTTRKNFIHQFFNGESIELTGQFSYGPNLAFLKGVKKIYSHGRYADGTYRKLVLQRNVNLKFYMTPEGFCTRITDLDRASGSEPWQEPEVLAVNFNVVPNISTIMVAEDPELGIQASTYYPVYDQYGNITTFNTPYNFHAPYLTYTYDYNAPRGTKNFSYVPSQNTISQEYSLLETMQWLPQSNHQRKSVSTTFWMPNSSEKHVQTQKYQNYQFDAKGNMTSFTYADNIPVRTTWHCRE